MESTIETHPLSPSSSITRSTSIQQTTPIIGSGQDFSPSQASTHTLEDRWTQRQSITSPDAKANHARPRSPRQVSSDGSKQEVRPFFAGESEGLEFLFDLCCPDRPIRGLHYAVPAQTYRAKRSVRRQVRPMRPLPPPAVQQELIRIFFRKVWPLLPVVDVSEFLTTYQRNETDVSPLLLWSIFFAAASVSLRTAMMRAHCLLTSAVRRSRNPKGLPYAFS